MKNKLEEMAKYRTNENEELLLAREEIKCAVLGGS